MLVFLTTLCSGSAWVFLDDRVSDSSTFTLRDVRPRGAHGLFILNPAQRSDVLGGYLTCYSNNIPSIPYVSAWLISSLPASFDIAVGGHYYFWLYRCSEPLSVAFVEYDFHNEWGYLSWSDRPILFGAWLQVAAHAVLLALIVVNWFHHSTMRLLLHRIIVISVSVELIASFVVAVCYLCANRSMLVRRWVIAASAAVCVGHFAVVSLSLVVVAGLSIVYDTLDRPTIGKCIGPALAFAIFEFFSDSQIFIRIAGGLVIVVTLVSSLVIAGVYVTIVYLLLEDPIKVLDAHLAMCLATRLAPETTPSEQKTKMLVRMKYITCTAIVLVILALLLQSVVPHAHFISYFEGGLFVFVLHAWICWACRLRKEMAATYGESAEDYEIPLDNTELRSWEYGMELPPMPVLVEGAPSEIHGSPQSESSSPE
jgi:hypothetical protein